MVMFTFSLQCHSYLTKKAHTPLSLPPWTLPSPIGSRLGVLTPSAMGSMTSGLVGEMQHQVLPAVPPWVTLGLTLAAILVRNLYLMPSMIPQCVCVCVCVCACVHVCVCVCVCACVCVCVFVLETNVIPHPSPVQPALVRLWWSRSGPHSFLQCLVLCGFGLFMFGWHVHEKAIMMVTVPRGRWGRC